MRKDWNTVTVAVQAAWQLGWINDIERDVRSIIEVNALVKDHVVAGGTGTGCVCGVEIAAVIAHVIEESVSNWRAARHQGQQQSRKRV